MILWKLTALAIGVAAMFIFRGTAEALVSARSARRLMMATSLFFVLYLGWMAVHDEFVYVIVFYGTLMLATFALCVMRYRLAPRACGLILAGIAITVLAAGVQASHVRLSAHFNYNDLYHVIQMVSLYVMYRGAKELR